MFLSEGFVATKARGCKCIVAEQKVFKIYLIGALKIEIFQLVILSETVSSKGLRSPDGYFLQIPPQAFRMNKKLLNQLIKMLSALSTC